MRRYRWSLFFIVPWITLLYAGAALLFPPKVLWPEWYILDMFVVLIALGTLSPIHTPQGVIINPITTILLIIAFVYGPKISLWVSSIGVATGYLLTRSWPAWRLIFNTAQYGLSVALAGSIFQIMGGKAGTIPLIEQIPAFIGGLFALLIANTFFVASVHSTLRRVRFLPTWVGYIRELLWSNLLTLPFAVLLVILYIRIHPLVLLAFLISLPFQRQALKLYFLRGQLYAQIVDALVIATDVNFPKAKGHSQRVAELSVAIAREMRLADPEVEAIQISALLHDVGMIGLDDLLERFGDLSPKDARRLEEHVLVGAEIARELPRKDIALMVLSHHERYDGTGYPRRLKGREIPLGARIIAVAETYESMTAGYPPYQNSHSHGEALQFIQDQAGKMFDPEVVQAFVRVCENGAVAWIESPPSLPLSPLEGEGAEEKGPPLAQPASLLAKVHLGGRGGDLTEPEVSPLSIDQSPPTPEERRDL